MNARQVVSPAPGPGEPPGKQPEQLPSAPDFASLRGSALRRVQQLSGEVWTDYNLHDPGVTLIEQFCYALTELLYQVDFDVAEHLQGSDAREAFDHLGLYAPERIFPCHPCTPEDLQLALLDAEPLVQQMQLTALPADETGSGVGGLYGVQVRRTAHTAVPGLEVPPPISDAALERQIRAHYAGLRNLCEDLGPVRIAPEQACHLVGRVAVDSAEGGPELLARIYRCCEQALCGDSPRYTAEQLAAQGLRPEQIYSGPPLQHGYGQPNEPTGAPNLLGRLRRLPGVRHVQSLSLQSPLEAAEVPLPTDRDAPGLTLHWPRSSQEVHVALSYQSRPLPVRFEEFVACAQDLAPAAERERLSSPARPARSGAIDAPPSPTPYSSLQGQLPRNYGISELGTPQSAPAQDKARSKQLRGYLTLFDQLLANSLASLDELSDLFSPQLSAEHTYAVRSLEGSGIAALDQLYPTDAVEQLRRVYAQHDHFTERKGRLLDYLLALYGESFSYQPLRLGPCAGNASAQRERQLLQRKADFLQALPTLSQQRGAGLRRLANGAVVASGLAQRLGHVLGVSVAPTDSRRQAVHLVEHVLLRPRNDRPPEAGAADPYGLRLTLVAPGWGEPFAQDAFRRAAAEALKNHCPAHLSAEILWLGEADKCAFDEAYREWLHAWAQSSTQQASTQDSAASSAAALHQLVHKHSVQAAPAQAGGQGVWAG